MLWIQTSKGRFPIQRISYSIFFCVQVSSSTLVLGKQRHTLYTLRYDYMKCMENGLNGRFPLLRFRSALHCGYSGVTDIQDGLFFVLTRARTFKKARVRCTISNR